MYAVGPIIGLSLASGALRVPENNVGTCLYTFFIINAQQIHASKSLKLNSNVVRLFRFRIGAGLHYVLLMVYISSNSKSILAPNGTHPE